jgi:endonuclease/exonuclease/phosphatase family metal-dependent hydrolase
MGRCRQADVIAVALLAAALPACAASSAHPARPATAPELRSVAAETVIAPGAVALGGQTAGFVRAKRAAPAGAPPSRAVRELQMNLCDSGEAACYTGGRAVTEAVSIVSGAARPDLVTVNEVCRRDVTVALAGAMAARWPEDDIVYLFAPALDATGAPYRCQNGDQYGNGLLARVAAGSRRVVDTRYGVFTAQAPEREQRTFGCVDLASRLAVCVTHLTSVSQRVAATQCGVLVRGVIPALRRVWARAPVIVAGDLNLLGGTGACVPPAYSEAGDGGVQHVIGSPPIRFASVATLPMHRTDHPALLVSATPR